VNPSQSQTTAIALHKTYQEVTVPGGSIQAGGTMRKVPVTSITLASDQAAVFLSQ